MKEEMDPIPSKVIVLNIPTTLVGDNFGGSNEVKSAEQFDEEFNREQLQTIHDQVKDDLETVDVQAFYLKLCLDRVHQAIRMKDRVDDLTCCPGPSSDWFGEPA
jgi:hypothetical protein